MKFLKLFSVILLFVSTAFAQVENASKPVNNQVRASFFEDILNFNSTNPGQTRVDVFIQVPYTEMQFVKSGDLFTAEYTISISIYTEEKEKLITEKLWSEKISTRDFSQTTSKNNFNLSLKSFNLDPGIYVIRSSVEDKESQKSYVIENPYTVKNLALKPSISDILLISRFSQADTSSAGDSVRANKILPNISRNLAAQRDGIPFFYEIYSDSARPVTVTYQILDNKKNVVYTKDTVQNVQNGKTQVFHTILNQDLGLGNYQLAVAIKGAEDDKSSSASKSFVSRWIGVPSVIKDLDKAIAELVYIASSKEISEMKDADEQSQKVKLYMDFWKKKDPSPNTEENEIFDEYYRRVAFANDNFSHYIEGWRTDRGMVFIILGAPNNVERHPFDYDSKPYEVWQYYDLNKDFIFVDETGFGDYRLVTPMYGDQYRFR